MCVFLYIGFLMILSTPSPTCLYRGIVGLLSIFFSRGFLALLCTFVHIRREEILAAKKSWSGIFRPERDTCRNISKFGVR